MRAVHHTHTGALHKISWSQRALLWDMQSLHGQAAAVLFTKGGEKTLNTENEISFVKLGKFYNIRGCIHEAFYLTARSAPNSR